jgi:hypothetical protein
MNDNKKNGLSRRNLLKAALAIPIMKSLPIGAVETGGLSEVGISALGDFLLKNSTLMTFSAYNKFNRAEDVQTGKLRAGALEEVFGQRGSLSPSPLPRSFSENLAKAWKANLSAANARLEGCEEIERLIATGTDIKPKALFSMLLQSENREKITHLLYEREVGSTFSPAFNTDYSQAGILARSRISFFERLLDGISDLAERHPSLRQARSLNAFAQAMRQDVSEALGLPLKNGCLDQIEQDGIEKLERLLDRAPELFPKDKLPTFKRLAADLAQNGKQTISLEDLSKPGEDWRMSMKNLPHRLGLTPLQEMPQRWVKGDALQEGAGNFTDRASVQRTSEIRDVKEPDGR